MTIQNNARAGGAQASNCDARDQFVAWLNNNEPGDVFQEILAPAQMSRAIYGAPVRPSAMAVLVGVLGDGDYAIVQSPSERLWIFSEHGLLLSQEAA